MYTQKALLLVLLLGVSLAAAHFTDGKNFCDDEKERYDTCKPLVSHDGCECSNSDSNSKSDSSSDSSSDSGSLEGSGSGSGSGSGNGSWEISGELLFKI